MNVRLTICRQLIVFLGWALLFNSPGVFSQTDRVEILLDELKSLKGEAYFAKSNDLAELYLDTTPLKAQELMEQLLARQEMGDFPLELARSYYIQARAYTSLGAYEKSYEPFDRALIIFRRNKDETSMARCFLGKGIAYIYHGQHDQAETALDKSLALYIKNDNESGKGKVFYELGHFHYIFGDDEKALEYYEKSLAIQKDLDDRKGISNNYFRMALAYLSSDKGEALTLLDKSRRLKEQIGDMPGLAKVGISLGVLHEENENFQTALSYYRQSLAANKAFGDQRLEAIIFNNMGIVYVDQGIQDSAIVYHQKALALRKELGNDHGIVQSLANLGEVYQISEDFNKGLRYFLDAQKISEANNHQPMMPYISEKLGEIYLSLRKLDSAGVYFNKALIQKKEEGNYSGLNSTYRNLSKLSEEQGNYKKSLEYYKLYKAVQDSVFNTAKDSELAEVQAKYDTERQEREIISLQQKNREKTLWQNIFGTATLVAFVFIVLIVQFFRFRNKKNRELLVIEGKQRQQLEEMDRLKSRFFHNISHEFRTPLTLILGPLDKLRKHVDEAMRPTVDVIDRNGKRLLKLINQLLELSKIEAGKTTLKAAYMDIVPLLKGWAMSFHSMAEMKDIKLSVHSEKEAFYSYIDKGKMEEIIINLLSNALKYTSVGGEVSVNLKAKEENGQKYLSIAVSDTGEGIPEEEQDYIFDRFYQAANADSDNVVGTGIGLSLIKELVDLHKGTIAVQSEVGVGSTFEIKLPFGKAHLSEEDIHIITPTSEPTPVDAPDENASETVTPESGQESLPLLLLIEDNEDLRHYVKSILHTSYQIREAENGKIGMEQAFECIPDVIVSDLMMPKVDGLQLCKTLKEDVRTSHIPIILLTARSSREDRIEGLKNLADDYLTKPFNNEELLVRIENLVKLRKKMQSHFGTDALLMPKKIALNSVDEVFMENITATLEAEISNPLFGVEELAAAVALSRSQLYRKIRAITDLTPNEYIRSFRLYRAMDMLKQNSATIAEIAYEVGFQNPSYFAKCFQEQFGKSPSAITTS